MNIEYKSETLDIFSIPENVRAMERAWELEKSLLEKYPGHEMDSILSKRMHFTHDLKMKYPDYNKYAFYKFLVGGGFEKQCTIMDFPGKDSVLKFFEDLNSEEKK